MEKIKRDKKRIFEVRMRGNINAEGLYRDLKSLYVPDTVISVKEK